MQKSKNAEMWYALGLQDLDKLKAAIENSADVNDCIEENGCRPIHLTVFHEDEKAVSLLLAHGADITVQDGVGETPLHYLYPMELSGPKLNIFRMLLCAGADIKTENNEGHDFMHYIPESMKGDILKIVQECQPNLILKGANRNQQNSESHQHD